MKKMFYKLLSITATMLMLLTPFSVSASSTSRYLVAVLYDNSSFKIQYSIYEDKDDKPNGLKAYAGGDYKGWNGDSNSTNLDVVSADSINVTWLLFPGAPIGKEPAPTSEDKMQADNVVGGLVNSLNTAIAYVATNGNKANDLNTLQELATAIANAAVSGSPVAGISFTKGGATEEMMESVKAGYGKGITPDDYVTLTPTGSDTKSADPLVLMWKCPKGYSDKQYLNDGSEDNIGKGDTTHSHLSWATIVSFANDAADTGLYADNKGWGEFYKMGTISELMSDLSEELTNKGPKALGLATLEELVFARNERQSSYYLGMMPATWFDVANSLFWAFEVLGVFILFASILYTIYKQNYAVISPTERLSVQDHIANILLSILLLAIYPVFFYILAKTNSLIVSLFDGFTGGMTLLASASFEWWLVLIMAIVDLVIIVKLNIEYLTRAVTITVLHVIAPVAIASISITGKKGGYFSIWVKEMIGSIFIQSFDAIIAALFIVVLSSSITGSFWESKLMMFMFIPLNSWFKQTFLGTTSVSGIAKATGQSAANAASKTASVAKGIASAPFKAANKIGEISAAKNQVKGLAAGDKKIHGSGEIPEQEITGTISGGMSMEGNISSGMKKGSVTGKEGRRKARQTMTGNANGEASVNLKIAGKEASKANPAEAAATQKKYNKYARRAAIETALGFDGLARNNIQKARNLSNEKSKYQNKDSEKKNNNDPIIDLGDSNTNKNKEQNSSKEQKGGILVDLEDVTNNANNTGNSNPTTNASAEETEKYFQNQGDDIE